MLISQFIWSAPFRLFAFWGIFFAALYGLHAATGWLDLNLLRSSMELAVANGVGGKTSEAIAAVSSPAFIGSLSALILATCAALLTAFLVMHTLVVRLALYFLGRPIAQRKNPVSFATDYETQILPRLRRHPLIGHAWKEFDETLLKAGVADGGPILNTIRPQGFVNYALAREKLAGLKVIGSISGYFVGIGLLLTFIGIVLALHEAAESVKSTDTAVMQDAMRRLLSIASLKFSTSIAGLGASIIFAILSKFLVIWIEGAFSRFCEAVEVRLIYTAPQSITAEMHEVGKEQRDQLKEINSDRYFTKLADVVAPLFEAAMSRAMTPVTSNIATAVEQLKSTSQSGLADMTKDFAAALHGSAGAEMRGLQDTLREIQLTLSETHSGLQGGGEDFSRRLSEAAENLNRLVGEAGVRLEGSAEQSRAGLAEVVAAFRQTMEAANTRVEAELGSAAAGASGKIEEAMARVLERLEGQVGSLMSGLGEFQANAVAGLDQTKARLSQAQEDAVGTVAAASSEAAKALQEGLASAFERIAAEIDRFQSALGKGELALSHQAAAIGDATGKTREVADAFAQTAQNVRLAAAPLVQSAEQVATATKEVGTAVERSVTSLESANAASSRLAESLAGQIQRLAEMWEGYRAQFDKVDQDLARAVAALSDATTGQSERFTSFARETDTQLGEAVTRLGTFLGDIRESTADLSDSVEKLVGKLRPAAE